MFLSPSSALLLLLLATSLVNSFQVKPGFSPPRRERTARGSAALATVDAIFQSSPYTAAAIACGVKASAADFVAQKGQLRKRDKTCTEPAKRIDLKRNFAFLVYGSVYQGIAQEFIYNHVYPSVFGARTTVSIVLAKVAFDMFVQTVFMTLPIAYVTKAMIYRYKLREALRRYRDDILNHGLLRKYWSLWFPVQCLTFGVVPQHYRVTFIAFVSFFWLIVLSSITSRGALPAAAVKGNEECELADGLTCSIDG